MDDHDDIDDLLEDPSKFHKDLQKEVPKQSGQRTNADDVIDAIGDFRPQKKKLECPQCNGTELLRRKPLGAGMITYVCTACRFKFNGPSTTNARLVACKQSTQSPSGPYYRPSKSLPAKPDKNSPKFRSKSKSRSWIEKKKD